MPKLAFDRASVRFLDEDGRLRVGMSNISKAMVNPYYGREIPRNDELGLDPDKVYLLLRDPEEMEKGIATFNNVPLLTKHLHQKGSDPQTEYVVGATGSDAVYVHPYIRNSLVIWNDEAINGVTSEVKSQLSSSYHYDADMTPGAFEGTHFDGVMRNIRANHVALVEAGRAGPDVVVGDSQFLAQSLELIDMKKTRTAVAVQAALGAFLKPKLAADAAPGDLAAMLGSVSQQNVKKSAQRIAKDVVAKFKTKLANDMEIEPEELIEVIEAASEGVIDEPPAEPETPADDEDNDSVAKVIAMLEGKLSPEELAAVKQLLGVEAEVETASDTEKDKDTVPKAAMDAAIKLASTNAEQAAVKRMLALRQAEKDVQPFVGEVVAMDSAEAVYKFALEHAKVDLDGVPAAAYGAMVRMLPRHGTTAAPRVAQDAAIAVADGFHKRFPNAVAPVRS